MQVGTPSTFSCPLLMLLLSFIEGANCNATDRWGSTPLIRAISNGHARLAMLLLEAGADPNARTAAGLVR